MNFLPALLLTTVTFLVCVLFVVICLSFGFPGAMFLLAFIVGGMGIGAAYEGRI